MGMLDMNPSCRMSAKRALDMIDANPSFYDWSNWRGPHIARGPAIGLPPV